MYIIELFFRLKGKLSQKKLSHKADVKTFNESTENAKTWDDLPDETANCKHIFVPIDSTKEVLACSLCGLVVHTKDIKKKKDDDNFFVK